MIQTIKEIRNDQDIYPIGKLLEGLEETLTLYRFPRGKM